MLLEKYRKVHFPKTLFPEFVVDREKCTQCGRCIEACPTMGLEMGTDGFPYLRGFKGIEKACLACRNCEVVCPSGAARLDGVYRVMEGRYKTILRGKNSPPNPFNDPEPPSFESVSQEAHLGGTGDPQEKEYPALQRQACPAGDDPPDPGGRPVRPLCRELHALEVYRGLESGDDPGTRKGQHEDAAPYAGCLSRRRRGGTRRPQRS